MMNFLANDPLLTRELGPPIPAGTPRTCAICQRTYTVNVLWWPERCCYSCQSLVSQHKPDADHPPKVCPGCNRTFTSRRQFCSAGCRDSAKRRSIPKRAWDRTCHQCEKRFKGMSVNQRYCTPACRALAQLQRERNKPTPVRRCRVCDAKFALEPCKGNRIYCTPQCQKRNAAKRARQHHRALAKTPHATRQTQAKG